MITFRTPEERFSALPDYEYGVEYLNVGPGEMAYVDVGGGDETFLCLHGEPTWGYLYRDVIPTLREVGRVVVPDFIGFGRSDKFAHVEAYTFGLHYVSLSAFVERLDLEDVTLVCHDWGGLLGLPVAALRHPERFARLVPMNTGIPTGGGGVTDAWRAFRDYMAAMDDPPISTVVRALGDMAYYHGLEEQPDPWTAPVTAGEAGLDLDPAVGTAYDAPFHGPEVKAGARQWPSLVPTDPSMEGAEIGRRTVSALADWEKPAFVLFSDGDPVTRPARDALRELIPGATKGPDVWVHGVGHFLQEEAGEAVASLVVDFVDDTDR